MTDSKIITKTLRACSQNLSSIASALEGIKQTQEKYAEKVIDDQNTMTEEKPTSGKNYHYLFGPIMIVTGMILCMMILLRYLSQSALPEEVFQNMDFSSPNTITEIKHLIMIKYILCLSLFLGFCGMLLGVYKIYIQYLNKKAELEAKAKQDNLSFKRFLKQLQFDSEYQTKECTRKT